MEFEIELIKQVDITIDYILELVAKYHKTNCKDKDILVQIDKAVNSSIELRSKKDLIDAFIKRVNTKTNVEKDWSQFVREQRDEELDELISENKLKDAETRTYLANAFRDGVMSDIGTGLASILPPMSLFSKSNNVTERKNRIFARLKDFFDKYFGLCTFDEDESQAKDAVSEKGNLVALNDADEILNIAKELNDNPKYRNVAEKERKYKA